jgi:2-methylcitrate dehydratase PrpD
MVRLDAAERALGAVPGATVRLAGYTASARVEDLPQAVVHEAARCFMNFVGCAIGGTDHDVVRFTQRALAPFAGPPRSSLVGLRRRSDPLTAALINGASASAHSFDDTHAEAIVHPGAPVAAATLALAQTLAVEGRTFLGALALGVEATCRLSKAVSCPPAEGDVAWYQTGIAGGIGAAVACGRLLGLDPARMANAIGVAVATASGSRILQGSMSMLLLAGHAAQCGLRAALLANEGFDSPAASLEGPHGFAAVYSKSPHLPWIDAALGERFEILSNTYKAYPCGVVLHPVVDACLEIRAQAPVDIESIDVRIHPAALALTDRPRPATRTEGQVSVQHWAAIALRFGRAGLDEGKPAALRDPDTAALRDRVDAQPDASLARDAAQVRVRLRSGAVLESGVHRGCRPLDDAALAEKLRGQATGTFDGTHADALVAAIWRLPDAASLDDVAALL